MVEDWLDPKKSFPGRDSISAEDYFYPLIEKQMQIDPDHKNWLASTASDGKLTEARALRHVRECFYKALEFLDDIDVWEVEFDASGRLPGLSVPIKAYVDIIGEHKKHGPSIVDWKSGKAKPKDNFQLETYQALLLTKQLGLRTKARYTGLWAMLHPEASKARPIDLSHVDPAEVGAKYQATYEKMQAKLYQTRYAKYNCNMCFQRPNCTLASGPTKRARFYDKADRDGLPY
jgi:RecB family exonuclease